MLTSESLFRETVAPLASCALMAGCLAYNLHRAGQLRAVGRVSMYRARVALAALCAVALFISISETFWRIAALAQP